MNAVLVYQGGIANVFKIEYFDEEGPYFSGRTRRVTRLYQGDFRSASMFAKGMKAAGCTVDTMACNQAGDIANAEWSDDLDNQPFSDQFIVVKS